MASSVLRSAPPNPTAVRVTPAPFTVAACELREASPADEVRSTMTRLAPAREPAPCSTVRPLSSPAETDDMPLGALAPPTAAPMSALLLDSGSSTDPPVLNSTTPTFTA